MTDPVPIRAVERQRVTRPHEVIETERVIEFATRDAVEAPRVALPCGQHPYDPACCSPMVGSGMELDSSAPARRALPPAPARDPWWRRRWWR